MSNWNEAKFDKGEYMYIDIIKYIIEGDDSTVRLTTEHKDCPNYSFSENIDKVRCRIKDMMCYYISDHNDNEHKDVRVKLDEYIKKDHFLSHSQDYYKIVSIYDKEKNQDYFLYKIKFDELVNSNHFKRSQEENWNFAKFDKGKDMISLVPPEIMRQIAVIRKYGTKKYKNPDNWKNVSKERYVNAMLRHVLAYIEDPDGVDAESGLPHLAHAACNMAFIFEMERPDWEEIKKHRTVYVKEEFEDECSASK